MSLLSLCVAIVYAQTTTDATLVIANDSLPKIENTNPDSSTFNNNTIQKEQQANADTKELQDSKNKLVKKTGASRAAGASRGSFSATAYCLRGRTAMGHGVRRGIIAADPRVLKLGSNIVVNGGGYSGTYLVSDTGGKIKGNRLDIWMPSCAEARKFGRRTVQVYSAK